MPATARREIRALLRAHLSAAAGRPHSTRHCPVCHRLLRLAMQPGAADGRPRYERAAPPARSATALPAPSASPARPEPVAARPAAGPSGSVPGTTGTEDRGTTRPLSTPASEAAGATATAGAGRPLPDGPTGPATPERAARPAAGTTPSRTSDRTR
ncbi:hypothetical protein IHE55_16050 [Streptomyces pactum]|uniref:Uncharacterized protein n=1 Tax=Streptomyces pactum TaxID=68249 RepID=A0ABS0NM07_9ACTN|nr:DUF6274 family protein [Streptomyces pactum]MBH5336216.1 hypothetical protein [Streptomyces pactum]